MCVLEVITKWDPCEWKCTFTVSNSSAFGNVWTQAKGHCCAFAAIVYQIFYSVFLRRHQRIAIGNNVTELLSKWKLNMNMHRMTQNSSALDIRFSRTFKNAILWIIFNESIFSLPPGGRGKLFSMKITIQYHFIHCLVGVSVGSIYIMPSCFPCMQFICLSHYFKWHKGKNWGKICFFLKQWNVC